MGWHSPTGAPTRDWLTQDGATALAAKISGYWAQRGVLVRAWAEPVADREVAPHQKGAWGVSSDLKVANGIWRAQT
jgi:hypothetical protein